MSPAFDVPVIRSRAVPRPRLIAEIGTTSERPPLAIVHGSAGSGKSTILAQWATTLAFDSENLAWITLNPDDAGVLPFWDRLETALVRNELIPADSPLHALSRQQLDETATRVLLSETFGALPAPLTIVLDDYHVVTSEAIDSQLRFIAENLHKVRLVIGSRATSGLHSLELAARVHTVLLDAEALAFTLDESITLVAESRLGANGGLASAIQDATLGWPLAIQALLVEAQRDPENESLLAGLVDHRSSFVTEFVRTLLAGRTAESQEFLLRIALANECTVALAAELSEWSPAQTAEQLDRLETDGIGTWQIRGGVRWFRLHPLLQESLEAEAVQRLDSPITRSLRGLLSDRLQNSRPLRALELAFASEDWERMERLVLLRWLAFSYYHRASFVALLRRVPRSAMRAHPAMLASELVQEYGNPHQSLNQLTTAFATVAAATRAVTPPPGVVGALAEIMTVGIHRLFGDMTTALARTDRALALLDASPTPEREENAAAIPVLLVQAAVTHLIDGQYLRALDEISRGRELAVDVGSLGEQFQALAVMALTHAVRGDIAQADEWIARCEQADAYDGWLGGYLQAGYHIAKAIRALNNWDAQAAHDALTALAFTEPVIEYWPYIAIAQAHADLILLGPAEAHSGLVATLVRKRWRPQIPNTLNSRLVALRAQLLLLGGQPVRANTAIEQSGLRGHPEVDLVRARLLSVQGEHDQAISLADSVAWAAEENPALRAEALLAVAAISYDAENLDRAAHSFEQALGTLSKHQLRFPLIMVSPERLTQLVTLANDHGIAIPQDMFLNMPTVARRLRKVEPLSKAERRVLQALLGTTDVTAVAESLHLSVHTVRYHLKRSYRKLGVSSRADAISLAQELGVLGEATS